jgi:hypothetical protein
MAQCKNRLKTLIHDGRARKKKPFRGENMSSAAFRKIVGTLIDCILVSRSPKDQYSLIIAEMGLMRFEPLHVANNS